MTTAILADAVLEEAETIVWAEWMHLLYATTPNGHQTAPCAELPAARPRPPQVLILAAMRHRPRAPRPGHREPCAVCRRSSQPVWPTQRSPPPAQNRPCYGSCRPTEVMP